MNVRYRKRIDSDTEDKLLKEINMNKQQAQTIIKNTFESSFDKSGFTGFVKNLLNRIGDDSFTYQENYIPGLFLGHLFRFKILLNKLT